MATKERLAGALADRYRIERELGQGGMATVYLAHDVRHDRRVALKVLKPELAAVIGAERFLAEIKTTANMQHPHILALFDSGQVDGTVFYVMPFVDGESLRDRIAREKQLPIEDALRIAREVGDALSYAHGLGVIHRDIKPENILLQGGHALVADFGIALAASKTGGTRMTETGMSLGTPTYMSPEQAMGARALDARVDIYALGCVLYEMLTGDPPFTGSTAQAIVGKVLTEKPAGIRARRDRVPVAVERAVLTALEKLPADRFASAAEFNHALTSDYSPSVSTVAESSGRAQRRVIPTGALAALSLILVAAAAWGWLRPVTAEQSLLQLDTTFPRISETDRPVLSPDGTHLVYSEIDGTSLFVRALADTSAAVITAPDDYWTPFFSPDGKSLGYLTGFPGGLKVLTLDGGQVRTVVAAKAYGNGGAWADDGWIYYNGGERYGSQLMRVRSEGGAPEVVAVPDSTRNERTFFYPHALPGGRRLLLTVLPITGDASVILLDLRTKAVTPLAKGVAAFHALPGYLVIMQADGSIRASKFDAGSGKVLSPFVTLAEGADPGAELRAPIAVSASGTMLHFTRGPPFEVVRVTRDGRETPLVPGWKDYFATLSLSPDGSRLAVALNTGGRTEIWMKALPDGPFARLVTGVNNSYRPSWSPDGNEVVFTSDLDGFYGAYRVPADGSRPPTRLVSTNASVDEALISRDGKWVVYRQGSGTARHLAALQIGVDSVGRPLLPGSKAQEYSPTLSPDGRWIAYASDESGRDEVYIRPFPDVESAKYAVSRNGGIEPLWSHSGRELFFRTPAGEFVTAAIALGATPAVTSLRVLFRTDAYRKEVRHRHYTVAPDDQSFLFIKNPGLNAPSRTRLTTSIAQLYRAKVGR